MAPRALTGRARSGVEDNLRSLRVERMDLVNLRVANDGNEPGIPTSEQLEALHDLRGEGKLDLIGISNLAREHAIAFVPFFPLGSAFTGGPAKLAEDPAIAQVAAKHDVLPTQVALAWLLAHYERMLLIPGTTSVAHLEENLAAGAVALDEEDLATLENAQHVGRPI